MLLALAFALQTAPAATCASVAPPPAGFAAWSAITAVTTGPVKVGASTGLKMVPSAQAMFVAAPERTPAIGTFSGVYTVTVTTPATYRVALSAAAWIDVLDAAARPLKSVAHSEGPACSGIRKIVDFTLVPGRYTLQLSGAKDASMRVLIVVR